jgi:hypothetical protein
MNPFERLKQLDITARWDSRSSLPNEWPISSSYFPNLTHITIRLRFYFHITFESAYRSLRDILDLSRLQSLEFIDESNQAYMLPLSQESWAAMRQLLPRHVSTHYGSCVLKLPSSWDTPHLSAFTEHASRFDRLSILTHLKTTRASLCGILAGHPHGPVLPALQSLELTLATESAADKHPRGCRCRRELPRCPALTTLRIHLEPSEDVTKWMGKTVMRRLCIDAPPRVCCPCSMCMCALVLIAFVQYSFSDAHLATVCNMTRIAMVSILVPPHQLLATGGGLRQIFIERASDGKALRTSEVRFPPSSYAGALQLVLFFCQAALLR